MQQISIQQASFKLAKGRLQIPQLELKKQNYWAVIGTNGSGKTALAQALQNKLRLEEGHYENHFQRIQSLSFEKQQKLLEQTFKDRNNDCVSPDEFGKSALDVILNGSNNQQQAQHYAQRLNISHLLARPFIQLSTGESRKVLLCQALVAEPDLLILDEPFEGLDQQSVQDWQKLLAELSAQMALVLIINRFSDLPAQAQHIAVLDSCQLVLAGTREQISNNPLFKQLQELENADCQPLPTSAQPLLQLDPQQAPFELKNVNIQYGEKQILRNLSWRVERGQHWWVKGPNGAGKSTLLSILTGDHPQAFANHVHLFGQQRGSGETIWQIKQKIGYLSSQLHMDYRVNSKVIDVVLSGFFDSIGLYQKAPEALRLKAQQWLQRLGLSAQANMPFRSLSWGQQRLLLIARAMVKHPPILILDEPLQGLDGLNRKLVKGFIEQLAQHSHTQLIFVSHQDQDAPNCITHILQFVPSEQGYCYLQTCAS